MAMYNRNARLAVADSHILCDNRIYRIPPHVLGSKNITKCLIGDRIFINGYEFCKDTKEFKKTVRAWLECYFFSKFGY